MMYFGITGFGSAIAQAFVEQCPEGAGISFGRPEQLATDRDAYFLVGGYLCGRRIDQQSPEELETAWRANFAAPAHAIERIIAENDRARIVVIGSDSGMSGSFDQAYAASKAGMHLFVETRRLRTAAQQLVCIAPGIVEDAGMTLRRTDRDILDERRRRHPMQRFATAAEIATLAHFLLSDAGAYISGTTIRVNGGEHTWR